MIRLRQIAMCFTAFVMLAFVFSSAGCSNSLENSSPITPDLDASLTATGPPESPLGYSKSLGFFQFVFDPGSVRVETVSEVRGAQCDVTTFAWVVIDDFYFVEEERNWYVTATIRNISEYTGYDVRVVFFEFGPKSVVNQDGFMWVGEPLFEEDTRLPFVAYGKEQLDRVYPPLFQDTRTVVFHQPEDEPKLAPIGFWIDAMGRNRPHPMVENPEVEEVDDMLYQVVAYAFDHQSVSADLDVFVDLSEFSGEEMVLMYDDGEHGDGFAGDNWFGVAFDGDPGDGAYALTIRAKDPDGNWGENDVTLVVGEVPEDPGDCEPLDFWVAWSGDESCACPGEYGFQSIFDDDFFELVRQVFCEPGDFGALFEDMFFFYLEEANMGYRMAPFVIQLDERLGGGYELLIEDVCIAENDVHVEYAELVPTQCHEEEEWTTPYVIGFVGLGDYEGEVSWQFEKYGGDDGCE